MCGETRGQTCRTPYAWLLSPAVPGGPSPHGPSEARQRRCFSRSVARLLCHPAPLTAGVCRPRCPWLARTDLLLCQVCALARVPPLRARSPACDPRQPRQGRGNGGELRPGGRCCPQDGVRPRGNPLGLKPALQKLCCWEGTRLAVGSHLIRALPWRQPGPGVCPDLPNLVLLGVHGTTLPSQLPLARPQKQFQTPWPRGVIAS